MEGFGFWVLGSGFRVSPERLEAFERLVAEDKRCEDEFSAWGEDLDSIGDDQGGFCLFDIDDIMKVDFD